MMDDSILSFGSINLNADNFKKEPDYEALPLLITRNLVLFPGVTIPVALMRAISKKTATAAFKEHIPIGVVCENPEFDSPSSGMPTLRASECMPYGVVADVLQVIELPNGEHTAIVHARGKFKLGKEVAREIIPDATHARVFPIEDKFSKETDQDFEVLLKNLRQLVEKIAKNIESEAFLLSMTNLSNPVDFINTAATNLPIPPVAKQKMLATPYVKKRAFMLFTEMMKMLDEININSRIQEKARMQLQEQNKNAFLQQQLNVIRDELYGEEGEEIASLRKRLAEASLPEEAEKTIAKEIDRLTKTNPQTPDYTTMLSYIETVLDLPWNSSTQVNTDFAMAEKTLDSRHYGLEKVKERILEQMAVMMNNPKGKAPIICLVGAPGVGKTSLGISIAEALGRKYQRVSLGGLHDEAEIRGHRRTYIGAMPGRIIDSIRRAKSKNPVILLDEIDKIGADFKGDPAAAMLEVLDPEQNCRFHDNYIDVDFDLSDVLFIATANTLAPIAQPLLDRMEIIEISGYLRQEKMEIARRHLLPRICESLNAPEGFVITDDALCGIIEDYTAESGVRQLDKALASIVRKVILHKVKGQDIPPQITRDDLKEYLGLPIHHSDRYEGNDFAGVVTGLAWTSVGGEILFIESSLSKSKGEKLTLTGNLGDVMKESAMIALQYVKANAALIGINASDFEDCNLHIHVPEGAIPKDGPSAGITMATSIVSAFTGRKVRKGIAMTGEITLRGKVLPVGGIKEKILAAKRAGITDIVLSSENRKDVEDINAKYLEGLTFHYMNTVLEVIRYAVTDESTNSPS